MIGLLWLLDVGNAKRLLADGDTLRLMQSSTSLLHHRFHRLKRIITPTQIMSEPQCDIKVHLNSAEIGVLTEAPVPADGDSVVAINLDVGGHATWRGDVNLLTSH